MNPWEYIMSIKLYLQFVSDSATNAIESWRFYRNFTIRLSTRGLLFLDYHTISDTFNTICWSSIFTGSQDSSVVIPQRIVKFGLDRIKLVWVQIFVNKWQIFHTEFLTQLRRTIVSEVGDERLQGRKRQEKDRPHGGPCVLDYFVLIKRHLAHNFDHLSFPSSNCMDSTEPKSIFLTENRFNRAKNRHFQVQKDFGYFEWPLEFSWNLVLRYLKIFV